jgi:excisionase family DNA binding protein
MSSFIKEKEQQSERLLPNNILTAREVAAFLRLTVITVCKLAAAGELPGFKIGKSWRFERGEVMRRITAAKHQATTAGGHAGRKGITNGRDSKDDGSGG